MSERVELAPGYTVPRVLVGGWQLSAGHHPRDPEVDDAVEMLARCVEAGLDTFDCADIYTGVEELLGTLRRRRPDLGERMQVHTKLVPDRAALADLDRADVEAIVDRSLQRLGVERLDLVQFHWWDYDVPGWVEAAGWLADLRERGKVRLVGLTNFDAPRLEAMLEAGIPVVSNQVQYSLLDRRPASSMAAVCRRHGVRLLAYGTLAGGFLTDAWVGADDPRPDFANRSLEKYRLIIDDFGGWAAFQELLEVLAEIGARRGARIAQVAARYALDRPAVAAAIIGSRTGTHLRSNLEIPELRLAPADRDSLDAVLARRSGPLGPVFGLERVVDGPHARIMRTDLNRLP